MVYLFQIGKFCWVRLVAQEQQLVMDKFFDGVQQQIFYVRRRPDGHLAYDAPPEPTIPPPTLPAHLKVGQIGYVVETHRDLSHEVLLEVEGVVRSVNPRLIVELLTTQHKEGWL